MKKEYYWKKNNKIQTYQENEDQHKHHSEVVDILKENMLEHDQNHVGLYLFHSSMMVLENEHEKWKYKWN
jgi:putative methionine-R-sulfoxide reductase with GAF domain